MSKKTVANTKLTPAELERLTVLLADLMLPANEVAKLLGHSNPMLVYRACWNGHLASVRCNKKSRRVRLIDAVRWEANGQPVKTGRRPSKKKAVPTR